MRKGILISIIVALVTMFVVWSPFALHLNKFWGINFRGQGMETIVENFDGINFLVVAKTLYEPHKIEVDFASVKNWRENLYFSAHYPLFPLVVRTFDSIFSGPNALLSTIILSNVLLSLSVFLFMREMLGKESKLPLLLTLVSLFYPARMLAVRSVGSNEPLFIAFSLLSLLMYRKKKYTLSALLGSFTVLTRSPGILLFLAYGASIFWQNKDNMKRFVKTLLPYLLMPLSLVLLWSYYAYVYGSFFAYFQVGGNINLSFPPFQVFGTDNPWSSGMWLEDIVYIYVLFSIGIIRMGQKLKKEWSSPIVLYPLIYLASIFFIVHRDIARYSLPIAPFVLLGLSDFLKYKYVKYILLVMAIPVTLWTWNFLLQNAQPIMDWSPFL